MLFSFLQSNYIYITKYWTEEIVYVYLNYMLITYSILVVMGFISVCMYVCLYMGHSIKLLPKTDNRTYFIIERKLPCDRTIHSRQKITKQIIYCSKRSVVRPGTVTQQIFAEIKFVLLPVFAGKFLEWPICMYILYLYIWYSVSM